MTHSGVRVDFYILNSSDELARLHYAARLSSKGYANGLNVEVLCPNEHVTEQLDNLFWEFQPESFLPHCISGDSRQAPVTLCTNASSQKNSAFVINISPQAVEPGPSAERIAEIVIQTPEVLQNTRMHYSFYKKMGFQVVTHKMN